MKIMIAVWRQLNTPSQKHKMSWWLWTQIWVCDFLLTDALHNDTENRHFKDVCLSPFSLKLVNNHDLIVWLTFLHCLVMLSIYLNRSKSCCLALSWHTEIGFSMLNHTAASGLWALKYLSSLNLQIKFINTQYISHISLLFQCLCHKR